MPYKLKSKKKACQRRWREKNRAVIYLRQKDWVKKNPLRQAAQCRRSLLKTKYGITINEFEAFQKAQKNQCRICQKHFDKTPTVDHCHRTGAIRGLLCGRCNTGLGMFSDSLKSLASAMKYLKETNERISRKSKI